MRSQTVQLAGDCHLCCNISLGEGTSKLQSLFLGQLLTFDNILSMREDSVCEEGFPSEQFGFPATSMEAIAPRYIGPGVERDPMDRYRKYAGRN